MRLAFLDLGHTEYNPLTVDSTAIGGTESAVSYLSRCLARQGHEIFLIGKNPNPAIHDRVTCISRDRVQLAAMPLHALVCVGAPPDPAKLRAALPPSMRFVRWVHLPADQPSVQSLKDPADRNAYDALAMVSHWQRDQFHKSLGVDPARVAILRNAVGFPFERQFDPDESILAAKQWPPVIAYCSAPYRGLPVLLDAFPAIRAAIPGTRLKVFSGLTMYGMSAENDRATYGPLYDRCRQTEGVEYIGTISQSELARQMRGVSAMTYPNTFAESSCIVAMEAMAAGCRVVTTEFGALPETTAGYARLVPFRPTLQEFLIDYSAQVADVLREQVAKPQEIESFLRRQVDYINQSATWDARAREWATWLQSLPAPVL